MLQIIRSMKELKFDRLMGVYEQGNRQKANTEYSNLEWGHRLLEAEQEHYAFLWDFFREKDCFLAVFEIDGQYHCALRIEPYRDGYLLEALETAPDSRKKGYATMLVSQVLSYLTDRGAEKVYSHISKKNEPSVRVHKSCGFVKLLDYAVFIDGSVDWNTDTYLYVAK